MGCQCDRSDLSDKVMNAFWENLKIRNKKIQEIVDMIRTKKQSARDKIKPNKLLMLIEDLIQGENFIEQTQQMFSNALEYSRSEYKKEGLLFLSLLLFSGMELGRDWNLLSDGEQIPFCQNQYLLLLFSFYLLSSSSLASLPLPLYLLTLFASFSSL